MTTNPRCKYKTCGWYQESFLFSLDIAATVRCRYTVAVLMVGLQSYFTLDLVLGVLVEGLRGYLEVCSDVKPNITCKLPLVTNEVLT